MLMRANSLVKGYSRHPAGDGEMLLELLNRGVYPAVPSKGSVGASGDLSPLSHIALVLMGEGKAFVAGKLVTGAEALAAVGLSPVAFAAKEGLALINGTQIMTAVGALVVHDAALLMKAADIAAAMSLEALRGTRTAYDERIGRIRPHLRPVGVQRQSAETNGGSAESWSRMKLRQSAGCLFAALRAAGAWRVQRRSAPGPGNDRNRDEFGDRQSADFPRHRRSDFRRQFPWTTGGSGDGLSEDGAGRDRQYFGAAGQPDAGRAPQ